MDCAKQKKLVQSLVNLTRVGNIDWKPSLRANVFQVSFHENTVRIGLKEGRRQEEGGIMIQLVNGDGVVVESFTNVDLQAKHTCINPQPWFPIMMDLFDEARQTARSRQGNTRKGNRRNLVSPYFLPLPPQPAAVEKRLPPTQTEGLPLNECTRFPSTCCFRPIGRRNMVTHPNPAEYGATLANTDCDIRRARKTYRYSTPPPSISGAGAGVDCWAAGSVAV